MPSRPLPGGDDASGLTPPPTGSPASCSPARLSNKVEAQRLLYREVRERFGLSSQTAQLCINRASDAYKRDKSKRPSGSASMPPITYDHRTMSFKGIDR